MTRLLTLTEVAEMLSVNRLTVTRLIDRGLLDAVDLSQGTRGKRTLRIQEDSLERYMHACIVQARPVDTRAKACDAYRIERRRA